MRQVAPGERSGLVESTGNGCPPRHRAGLSRRGCGAPAAGEVLSQVPHTCHLSGTRDRSPTSGQLVLQATATVPVGAVPVPTNPYVVDCPAATAPFHAAFFTVNDEPELDSVPDHRFETVADIVNDVDHEAIAAEPALTVTPAWKPCLLYTSPSPRD